MTVFAPAEYANRLKQVKTRMSRDGVDVLLVNCPENIFYLTGYSGWSFYTPQFAIISLDDNEPLIVLRDMDTACASHTAFMTSDRIVGYPESYIGKHDKSPVEFIAAEIERRGWGTKTLGVEKAAHFFSAHVFALLQRFLPNASFVDAYLLVDWVRTYKSDAEIAIMRQAGGIADLGMRAAIEAIEPGVRECDAAGSIFRTLISGTPEFGGSTPASISMPSGPKTAAPHLRWTDDTYSNFTSVNVELGGARHEYHAGLSRTIHLGNPPGELVDLSDVVIEGFQTALAAVKPGATCEDIEKSWRKVISKNGYEKPSRIGYSIGLCFQPTWIDLTASLQVGDKTVLEPNMTFHLICGMWKGEHNFIISETFRVTQNSAERFSDLEQKLFLKS